MQDEEDIDMDTVHDSRAFIYHHLNMLDRPSTPGKLHIHTSAKHMGVLAVKWLFNKMQWQKNENLVCLLLLSHLF